MAFFWSLGRAVAGLVAFTLAASLAGCGMSVTPPAAVSDPVPVFIADHGIHSSLILSRDDGTVKQFAFSQWKWAALDHDQWYRSVFALLIPAPGTIGSKELACDPTTDEVVLALERAGIFPPVKDLYQIRVERSSRDALLAKLDARWAQGSAEVVHNRKRGLAFVKDAQPYSLMHNCNTEVSLWLRELGCGVNGAGVTADFTIKPVPENALAEGRRGLAREREPVFGPLARSDEAGALSGQEARPTTTLPE